MCPACHKLGIGGDDDPTGPSGPPSAGSTINYTAIGASDANGIGSSAACLPYAACPNGKGYVPVSSAQLRTQGYTVNELNLGIPTAVISQRLQTLGQQYGRTILGNFISDEMPFVQRNATLVTIFAGGNDVTTLVSAVSRGAGGLDPNGYLDQQVLSFGGDYGTLVSGIRSISPGARIVALNLPNLGGLPFMASDTLTERRSAQRLSVGMSTTVINPLVSQDVIVIDLMCEPRLYQSAYLSADGFHPNDAGYAILATEVVRAVTSASYPAPRSSCAQMTLVN